MVLCPFYLWFSWVDPQADVSTHLGAFTIVVLGMDLTLTLAKFPSLGIYVSIIFYVGKEVLSLALVFMSIIFGE